MYLEPVGTGVSARLDDVNGYALDRYTECLRALIDHLEAGPVHVLGHSHGGFVALRTALAYSDRIAGLVLYDTAARTGEEWFSDVMANVEEFARANADRSELEDILAALDDEATVTTDEEATSVFRRQFPIYPADYWGRERELRPVRDAARMFAGPNLARADAPYDLRERLPSIRTPTLIVVGRHDRILGPRWSQELHEGITGSQLVVLEASGHFGHLEEPEAFAGAVTRFVAVGA